MENKLKSSIEFGETLSEVSDADYRRLRNAHDGMLKQPLTLGQFVPCDEDGNVLEEPNNDFRGHENYSKRLDIYNEAKSRVLFEGFEIMLHDSGRKSAHFKKMINPIWETDRGTNIFVPALGLKTIQDLVPYNLTLTASPLY